MHESHRGAGREPNAWIPVGDPRLPEAVRHLAAPCRGLWFAGDPTLLHRGVRIGLVGSRHPREDSTAIATAIAHEAARAGFTIVSGLAIGIDGVAHRAALEHDAPTIGVLAGGLGRVHPVHNRKVAEAMAGSTSAAGVVAGDHDAARGLVLSEYGRGDEASHGYRFKERNRIIAALSDYLVVVQAGRKSGSMSTASFALALGVPIGVVPTSPLDADYAGATALIRDGADAVVDGSSLFHRLEAHGVMEPGFAAAARRGAVLDPARAGGWIGGGEHAQLPLFDHPLASIVRVPRTVDEIADLAGMDLRDARLMLHELEQDGAVVHTADGAWVGADAAGART